ncbi:flagellar basal body rod protein FlgG [Anoxybacillus gonensis]|uniref:Flagellar hook protein FlgE n=1 Tax=Anoxybacillus gonensis TaxID=198467 RepID=A0AAW7THU5_9BACL|nr:MULTISPECIES: flagellar basal body rod protein FlgG [Anoxybacillus]AXM87881.1 flagellar basal-body rod protein FlgG [Anoxybacillus ayderensis G10]THD16346.1 flagellar basal body rod protein FlgG [Anoxybacillus ayderensis]AKS38052.1 flagellar basal body rod protein FlgG [Anoxybacillus gonensis]KGP60885.1 flagellar basal body rod protein FlgG [Anoxybacillus gonensis]MBW9217019.1 flagellar basal body rod protein FlgG [Anoxybacillus sp. ST70]
MLRSMYSGIGGMKNFQVKLDVIGNNIANVNTYGFKKGRTIFKDLVSQQISGASGASGGKGGVNPKQVGLGSQLSAIDTVHTQGSLQTTGRVLDLAISGDGFFVVGNVATPPGAATNLAYTRAGNFYLDQNGDIVNADGFYLVNTAGQSIRIPSTAQSMSIGADGTVSYVDASGNLVTAGTIRLAKFNNNEGLEKVGQNLYRPTTNSGAAVNTSPGLNGAGILVPGTLEMSNVDLAEEFTEMIVAQRGFQANTRIITTSDEILQELVNLKR